MAKTMKALKEALQNLQTEVREEVQKEIQEESPVSPVVTIKVADQKFTVENSLLAETLYRAWNIKREIDSLEPTFQELKNIIVSTARGFAGDHGTVTFTISIEGLGRLEVKVTFQYETIIEPEHINEVRKILGDQFSSLVRAKYKYVGTKRLLELLQAGDPRLEAVLPYIAVKEFGRSVQFKLK